MTEIRSAFTPETKKWERYTFAATCSLTNDRIVSNHPAEIITFAEEHGPVDITFWPRSDRHAD